jgi:hypothetical protein
MSLIKKQNQKELPPPSLASRSSDPHAPPRLLHLGADPLLLFSRDAENKKNWCPSLLRRTDQGVAPAHLVKCVPSLLMPRVVQAVPLAPARLASAACSHAGCKGSRRDSAAGPFRDQGAASLARGQQAAHWPTPPHPVPAPASGAPAVPCARDPLQFL